MNRGGDLLPPSLFRKEAKMEQIEAMRKLGMSKKEIQELIAFDAQVDKMKDKEVNDDLTDEQKKTIKKARQAERKPTTYNFNKRERKENTDKQAIISFLCAAIEKENGNITEITNKERELKFNYNGVNYKIVLSVPRK